MKTFDEYVIESGKKLSKYSVDCLQMNIGYVCNLNCTHCHIQAGPHRREQMSKKVIDDCISFAKNARVKVIDITGGAPELNPNLRHLISEMKKLDSVQSILLRSNLTLLNEPEHAGLAEFLAENNVEIVASMPCYLEENVAAQRGTGVYDINIKALKKLNRLGYGTNGHKLHLVYNPGGDFLPGPQPMLEDAYKEYLGKTFEIEFNSLYTITNIPIGRFRSDLEQQGRLDAYLKLLADNFNPETLSKVMCLNLISVDWQGRVYDCDFNHVLQMPIETCGSYIGDISVNDLTGTPIRLGEHCFACTAGSGSSCQGSLN